MTGAQDAFICRITGDPIPAVQMLERVDALANRPLPFLALGHAA